LALRATWAPLGMACHGFGSCRGVPIPIGVRSLTPGLSFYVCGGWRQCGPPSKGDRAPSGSGGAKLLFLGSGEASSLKVGRGAARPQGAEREEPVPLGSGELEPVSWGSGEATVTPFNRPFDFDCWGPLVLLLRVP
jgi:hypothetical protein